jgi:hypothetical protein
MRSIFSQFKGDTDKEAGKGVVLDYGEYGTITIRRAGGANLEYQRVARERLAPYERRLAMGTLSEEESRRVMAEVYADSVIIGWTLADDNGPIPFTRENVVRVMIELPDLFADVREAAEKRAFFVQQQLAEDTKN